MGGELSKQRKENILEVDSHISKQVYKGGYRLPNLEDIYHIPSAIRKEYSRMSNTGKALFWLTGFALLGVAGYASSDAVKKTVDKNYEKGSKFVKEKYANAFAPAPAVVPAANVSAVAAPQVSETPYQFTPDIQIFGNDEYKQKIQNALDEIKRTNITEYNEVMLYWETIDEKNVDGHGYLAEKDISPSNLIHDKEHIKQARVEPFKSYYTNKSGWYMELDAVKAQVDWEVEAYNYTDERKQQQIKRYMDYYKDRYPEQYAKWVSES